MKKFLKYFVLAISSVLFIFLVVSCNNSNDSTTPKNDPNPQANTENGKYTVKWKNWDDTILEIDEDVEYGTTPTYDGDAPTRDADYNNKYVFNGWDKIITAVTKDIEYKAVFDVVPASLCGVNFDSKGGTSIPSQSVIKGEKAKRPTNPTKEGYTFNDWYYQGEKWSFIGYTVTEDMTLEAKWNINYYDLNLNVNNSKAGTISNNSGTHYYNEYITITATTNPGYTFNGWYEGDNLISIKEKYSFTMPLKGLSYTAKWSVNTNTPYKVEHYKQNSDGTYPTIPNDVDNLTGETNTLIYAYAKAYEGFILPTAKPVYINGDGSTLIKLYYEMKSYEISVTNNYSAGEIVGIGTHKYGEKVNIEITPYMGYEYEGIYIDNNFITKELSYEIDSISSNVEIRFKVLKDLDNFTFESTKDTLKITGIKDKTVKSIKIPNGVTSIGSSAFYECSSLTSITIPSSVTSIGNKSFYRCTSLTSIEIPNSVTNIGTSAFSGCSKLESMTLPFVGENVTNNTYLGYIFGADSYSDSSTCIPTSLKEVIISEGCISIGTYAFYNCKSLTSITIPNSVTTIGQSAFFGCSKLESITLPFVGDKRHTLTDSNQYPFGYIFGTSSYIGGVVTSQYYYGSSTSSEINNNHYYIPSTLKEVILTDCEYIQYGAFYNCRLITNITMPNSVTSIGEKAFYNCSSLTSITIPNSVTSIGTYAFDGTFVLLDVYYDGKIEDWCNILFNGNPGLMHEFEISNKFYLLDKNGDVEHNDKKYSQLTELVIPNTVKTIGSYQFYGFVQLKSITMPDSVTSIGNYAFDGCRLLTSVAIPSSVTSIGNYAFDGCSSLTSVTIPNRPSIGNYAFDGCISLANVYYYGKQEEWSLINIQSGNSYLTSATRYYYSEIKPSQNGNYWHYVDGIITIWE